MIVLGESAQPTSWAWLYVAAEWLIRIGMIAVVLGKRRPNVALAWLALVVFQPIVALVLYLLIGAIRVDPAYARRYAELRARERPVLDRGLDLVAPQFRDFVRLSESLNLLPPTAGNDVDLEGDHDRFIDRLIADIDGAKFDVRMLYYIYWDDQSGRRVSEALKRATARGVTCRLLIDAAGSRSFLGTAASGLRAAGVDVRPALVVRPWRAFLVRADLRNHRKLAVIDGRIAWTGSHNVCDADYGGNRCGPWIDLSARIVGPAVGQLSGVFAEDWYAETGEMPSEPFEPGVQDESETEGAPANGMGRDAVIQIFRSGPTGPGDALEPFLIGALHEAERRVVITSPYLVPTQPLLLELRVAVLRGVRVDLIVPERSNHPVVHAAGRAFFDELLAAGVRVHLHRPGLLHSKTMLVDDSFALVGSANFDVRSIALNFELNLIIFGPRAMADLERQQGVYLERSRRLDPAEWKNRSRARKLGEDLARLFSPLL
jgi:cardiolipin synthase A/B